MGSQVLHHTGVPSLCPLIQSLVTLQHSNSLTGRRPTSTKSTLSMVHHHQDEDGEELQWYSCICAVPRWLSRLCGTISSHDVCSTPQRQLEPETDSHPFSSTNRPSWADLWPVTLPLEQLDVDLPGPVYHNYGLNGPESGSVCLCTRIDANTEVPRLGTNLSTPEISHQGEIVQDVSTQRFHSQIVWKVTYSN
jgi:hypothetical protein